MLAYLKFILPLTLSLTYIVEIAAQKIDSLAFIEGVTILFENAVDQLTADDFLLIDSLCADYKSTTTLYRIEGHTDDIGSTKYNSALAVRRANSVQLYLNNEKGIPDHNIFSDSYGELKPAKSNIDEHSRKYNRRVDLSIYTNTPMRKIKGIVQLDSFDSSTVAKILVNGKNFKDSTYTDTYGNWSIMVPDSVFVKLDISAPSYFFTTKRIKVTSALDKRQIKLELPKLEVGKVYDVPNFFFKGNSPVLLPSSVPTLEILYNTMASSEVCIHIKGHVNNPNAPPVDKSHNYYKLSVARSKTVLDYLVKSGININRMKNDGFGNWHMVYPKAQTEAKMKKNRRVEIEIIDCLNE